MLKCIHTGSLSATIAIYNDFFAYNYRSGIYKWNREGPHVGDHPVRYYGYSSDPKAHWMCINNNNWGTAWDENGFFKIAIGECGIETRESACCEPQS